jgi:CRP-like cAMP-binding protein
MRSRIPKAELDLLAAVPLFSSCSKGQLREVAQLGTRLDVATGKELTKEGASGREFFIVVEGEAECVVRGATAALLGPGDFFGEMALIDGGPRTATVRAASPLRVLLFDSREFSSLLLASPSIALKLLRTLAGRLRDVQAMAVY